MSSILVIEAPTGESVTIDLSPTQLDPDPTDVIDLLGDLPTITSTVYAKIASAYLQSGLLDGAEQIARHGLKIPSNSGKELKEGQGDLRLWGMQTAILGVRARAAPKLILNAAEEDVFSSTEKTKDVFYKESAVCVNAMQSGVATASNQQKAFQLAFLTRGIHQMNTRDMDQALISFDQVLKQDRSTSTNVVALLGKARVLYLKKQYQPSLKLYQRVLTLSPTLITPDPRVGIGLCLWGLGHVDRSLRAFERALEMDGSSTAAQAFLGLALLNLNRSSGEGMTEQRRREVIVRGTKLIQGAWNTSGQKSAASANVLCDVILKRGEWRKVCGFILPNEACAQISFKALKLAERTIQYTDTLALLTDGWIKAGRVCFNWAKSIEKTGI